LRNEESHLLLVKQIEILRFAQDDKRGWISMAIWVWLDRRGWTSEVMRIHLNTLIA